jgi:hypothetical protein
MKAGLGQGSVRFSERIEASRKDAPLAIGGIGMQVRMYRPCKTPVGSLDLELGGARREAQSLPSRRVYDGLEPLRPPFARPPSPMQKVARPER